MKHVFGGIITLLFLLVSFFLFDSSFVVAQDTPQVDSVTVALSGSGDMLESIDLLENTTQSIYVYGEFSDADGCADVKDFGSLSASLYRSGVTGGSNCTEDNRNCYRVSYASTTCSIFNCSEGTEPTAEYECVIPVHYYAEPTDIGTYETETWKATVEVVDASSTSASLTTSTEMNSLVAIAVDNLIDYGSFDLGATSTTDTVLGITNTGNTTVDVDVNGIDMVCSRGVIPITNQRFSSVSGTSYDAMSVVSTTNFFVDLNLAPQVSDTVSTSSLFFKLAVPGGGLSGSCSGQNLITAKLDE